MITGSRPTERMRHDRRPRPRDAADAGATVAPGVTTDEVDRIATRTARPGAYPSTGLQRRFPKSVCTSVNEVICHGIPTDRRLATATSSTSTSPPPSAGVHGRHLRHLPRRRGRPRGHPGPRRTTRACRDAARHRRGRARPSDLRHRPAPSSPAPTQASLAVVRAGAATASATDFHTYPHVYSSIQRPAGRSLSSRGMTLTVEPMLAAGTDHHRMWDDDWTAVTDDGRCPPSSSTASSSPPKGSRPHRDRGRRPHLGRPAGRGPQPARHPLIPVTAVSVALRGRR